MGVFDFLTKRKPDQPSGGVQVSFAVSSRNPQDKLGDPTLNLRPETLDRDYPNRWNRGDLTIPTWALFLAIRQSEALASPIALWQDMVAGMDWAIKEAPDPDKAPGDKTVTEWDSRAKAQADALKKAYERVQIDAVVRHLALAEVYGYSVLSVHPDKLEIMNWWNFCRVGLYGEFVYNPDLRQVDGKNLPEADRIDAAGGAYVIRAVENPLIFRLLRAFLHHREIVAYWHDNLEKESKRQVVIIPGTGFNEEEATKFRESAIAVASGGSGCLAPGNSDKVTTVMFPPASRGLSYYDVRVRMIEEAVYRDLLGSTLIASAQSGSGTLAGNAHADTAKARVQGCAKSISATMQEQYDRFILLKAGLIQPGETPLAYFELMDRKTVDPQKEVEWAVQLKQAGFERDLAELEERTGMKLIKAEPTQQPAYNAPPDSGLGRFFGNRTKLMNRASDELGVPTAWLKPVRDLLNEIATKAEDKSLTEQELAAYVEQAARRVPELFGEMDVESFAELLEGIMGAAAVEGVRDALRH